MISEANPLYSVNGVFNGIFVKGNVLGDVMFYGSGAGKLPTASAVVSDIVDEVKHLHTNIMTRWSSKKMTLADIEGSKKRFYVRMEGSLSGRKKEVESVFGAIAATEIESIPNEFAFITEVMSEKEYKEKAKTISGILNRIRVDR